MGGAEIVFALVVGGRFVLPLFIPRYPLPAIIACLVLDGVDQTIFQSFGYDPPGYQGYDKAMDVFYLALAYLATLRNWTSGAAYDVGRFLYFYRLVGVVAFELFDQRWLLLVFANTFEYYFIALELIRLRWDPAKLSARWWVLTAAVIWVVVKLPQETWIHVLKLDLTDALAAHPWAWLLVIGLPVLAGVLLALVVLPRLGPPAWSWRVRADPLPEEMDTAAEVAAWQAATGRIRSSQTVEKVVLLGLISVIYAQTLPGVHASNLELFVGVGAVVVANAAVSLAFARRAMSSESLVLTMAFRLALSGAIVAAEELLAGLVGARVDGGDLFFFLVLISLVTTLHDRYEPVHAWRRRAEAVDPSVTTRTASP